MFDFLRFFIALFCWGLTWAFALWRGRWPERWMAIVTIVQSILSIALGRLVREAHFDWLNFSINTSLFAFLIFLAVRSGRIWPIVAAGLQMICVITPLLLLINKPGSHFVFQTVGILFGYFVLIAFQAGLVENELQMRRQKRAVAAHIAAEENP